MGSGKKSKAAQVAAAIGPAGQEGAKKVVRLIKMPDGKFRVEVHDS